MTKPARELIQPLIGLRAAVAEEHLAWRDMLHNVLRQAALRLVVVEVRNVHQPSGLLNERLRDLSIGMAEAIHRDATAQIQVALAAHVPHVTAFAARKREVKARVG